MICCIMVHCRSELGAWRHAQRSYQRGYSAAPPVFPGDLLPPPPPPPFFPSVEVAGPRVRWADLCEEEEAPLEPSPAVTPGVSAREDIHWNPFGYTLRSIIKQERSNTSRAVCFGLRLRKWMRRRVPVPADDCQAFYIGDTGITEDPLEIILDEYSADYLGELP